MTVDLRGMSREQFQAYYETLSEEHKPAALAAMKKQLRERGPALRAVGPNEGAPVADPEVLPLGGEAFEDWPTEWLPEPVRNWVEACNVTLGVPRVMAIAAALCSAATLCQGKLRVRIRPGWDEPVNLYWLVLAPTGARKSALLKLATEPVRRLQAQLEAENEPLAHEARCDLKRAEAQHSRLIRQIKAHKHTDGYSQHLQDIRELEHEIRNTVVPKAPRWLCDDVNPTVIPKVLKHNLEAEGIARLAVLDAEGTFLSNLLGRHDKKGSANVDPLLKAFNGEPVDMIRTSQTSDDLVRVHLPHSYVTMCLLVQPLFKDRLINRPELAENGFLGRCIVSETAARSADPPWDAPGIPDHVQEAYANWVLDFARLPQDALVDLSTSEEAQEAMRGMNRTVTALKLSDAGGDGWLARSIGKIARIYALLHAHVSRTVELSNCHRTAGGVAHTHAGVYEGPLLTYLFKLIISGTYARARTYEPPAGSTVHLATRLLGALQRRDSSTVENGVTVHAQEAPTGTLTLRTIQRDIKVSKEQALEVAEALVTSGHFELLESKQNRNRTLTMKFRIVSLDPRGTQPSKPKPEAMPNPEDDGRDPDFQGEDLT